MRRLLILAVALVAGLGMLAPPAMAQAPAPKVTITGFIDEVGTFGKNLSDYDNNYNRQKDTQATGRTRGRFDIIGELGKAKAVLGIELDAMYGQTGNNDTFLDTRNSLTGATLAGGRQCAGCNAGFDLNTDTIGLVEIKWLYTEFPLPIALPNTIRFGGQPFGTVATDKLAVYANGDFPGVALSLDFTPAARLNLTYVQVEEQITGFKDGWIRGEDWAAIVSFGFTPFKGLSIKPMYSFFQAQGQTSTQARQGRGGVDFVNAFTGNPANPASGGIAGASGRGVIENRHTIGVDSTFTAGPFSLQPTVLYQFGERHNLINGYPTTTAGVAVNPGSPYGAVGSLTKADISAWLVDVRGAFNVGPLTLAAMGFFTSGQKANSNPFKSVRYYQALDTDTSYLADWGTQIFSLGIDYFHILYNNATGLNPGVAIGYDKYGRMGVGAKASYAITPAFTVGAGVMANWTQYKVDTDSVLSPNGGLFPLFSNGQAAKGDSQYLGTEINASMTYRFAPGIAWDVAAGYLFAGDALGHALTVQCCGSTSGSGAAGGPVTNSGTFGRGSKNGVDDVYTATSRVRFSF
jgi:hypothetical protein